MQLLHTMLRVGDLQRSIDFYTNTIGMDLLRTTERPEQKYTLAFVAFRGGNKNGEAELELTYNHGVSGVRPRLRVRAHRARSGQRRRDLRADSGGGRQHHARAGTGQGRKHRDCVRRGSGRVQGRVDRDQLPRALIARIPGERQLPRRSRNLEPRNAATRVPGWTRRGHGLLDVASAEMTLLAMTPPFPQRTSVLADTGSRSTLPRISPPKAGRTVWGEIALRPCATLRPDHTPPRPRYSPIRCTNSATVRPISCGESSWMK